MLATLTNCRSCLKAFNDNLDRGLCAQCFGEKVFGRRERAAVPSAADASWHYSAPMVANGPDHVLRCELYAQRGRAHAPKAQRGMLKFW